MKVIQMVAKGVGWVVVGVATILALCVLFLEMTWLLASYIVWRGGL